MPQSETEKAAEAERVQQAQQRLTDAKARRDQLKDDADREFWTAVAAAIDSRELKQTEVCEAIDYKREYVRRQLIALRVKDAEQAADSTD